jgi:two-component system cell cycle sensor histidine kinase PleC
VIKVSDTGIGIAETDLGRVMEVFRQDESGLHRSHEGTGLGLPLAKRLAEAMDGRLTLASEVGVGTVATVVLPRQRIVPFTPVTQVSDQTPKQSAA